MVVTVIGAGAIGGVTGAALAQSGCPVLLVDADAEHVAAMNAQGLTVERDGRSATTAVQAITPDALGGPLELVLLAVKAQHTAGALDGLAPLLGPDGAVVSLQNGLNEELIAARVGRPRTVACLVNWGADWIAPGRIHHGGPGAFVLGELDGPVSARVRDLAALLTPVAETRVSDNVWGYKWAKLVYGALLFATALVDAHVFEVVERSRAVQRMLAELVGEGMAVADAEGVRLEAFDEYDPAWYRRALAGDDAALLQAMAAIASHYRAHAKTKTGVWRDLAVRRRKTEVDALLGTAAGKARQVGLAAPLTERVVAMIHEIEDGRRGMSWANLDELVALGAGRIAAAG